MKKSNLMKLLFIALSLVLVISLVACVSETPTEEPDESDSSVEESIPNNESEPKDSEEESSETPACEHVEEVVAGTAATCTTAGLTDGKKCSVCGETLVAQEEIPALGHTEEVVAGTAATCTTDGLTDGKKCSVCGETLVAQETIPAAHTEEVVTGTPATCETAGLTDGKKCSACGETLVAQEEIPALGHTKVNKAYAAPTTTEAGWYAHTACSACDKVWDTEGNAIDAVPSIEIFVPGTNKYWGAGEMSSWVIAGAQGSLFNAPEMSADRTYVRFSRAGSSYDGNVNFLAGNTDVTGQYIIIKYRTDHMKSAELWANTTENSHSNGASKFSATFVADNEWHLAIYNLAEKVNNHVKPNEDGTYTIQWARLDMLDSQASEGYIDIAYIAICDDLSKFASIAQEGDTELCPHIKATNATYTNNGENHSTSCIACGASIVENHFTATSIQWNAEQSVYVGNCVCGKELTSDMIYKTEAEANAANVGANGYEISQQDGFVRYTATAAKGNDWYIHVYRYGTQVTGQFMVIKYRVVNNGKNPTHRTFYAGSVAGGNTGATGNGDGSVTKYNAFIADGEWHYMIVTVPETNTKFTANADGTYSWAYLRLGFDPAATDGSCYIDIDEIAFCDNIVAAEKYSLTNNPNPVYVNNLDKSNCSLNGETLTESARGTNAPIVLDLEGKTVNDAATGLVMGGWCCTPGGVDSYKIRVTSVNGEVVEAPALVDWEKGVNRSDIYTAAGKSYGYSDSCAIGAGINKAAIDLSAYAGSKINFEIVAITTYGAEIVVAQVNNLTVAAAAAE